MGGGQNVLLERFMANATFKSLYEEKMKEVHQVAFASGAMSEMVEQYSALIHSANDERNLVDITSYDQTVEEVLRFISERTEYLASIELLSQ